MKFNKPRSTEIGSSQRERRFIATRDPVTGMVHMNQMPAIKTWGVRTTSQTVVDKLGCLRYDVLSAKNRKGRIHDAFDVHHAILVDQSQKAHGTVSENLIGQWAHNWMAASQLIAEERLDSAVLAIECHSKGNIVTLVAILDEEGVTNIEINNGIAGCSFYHHAVEDSMMTCRIAWEPFRTASEALDAATATQQRLKAFSQLETATDVADLAQWRIATGRAERGVRSNPTGATMTCLADFRRQRNGQSV